MALLTLALSQQPQRSSANNAPPAFGKSFASEARRRFSTATRRLKLVSERIKEAHVQNIEKLDRIAKDDVEVAKEALRDLQGDGGDDDLQTTRPDRAE